MAPASDDSGDGRKWSRPAEDLSGERVLRHCAKVEFEGVKRPTIGRIVLLAKLGKGGMGVVYFGVNPRLRTEVAVKVLPPEMEDKHDDSVDRFIREGRIAAGLFSDHLVSVLDVDKDEKSGAYFLVMEFVRGCTAAHWAKDAGLDGRRARPTEKDALDVCIAATKGLAAAHLEGILHRDVKPENILIPKAHGRPIELARAKLADLGLARPESAAEGITATAIGMGTPGFMSMEQARDARGAKKPADVFSMGATLYAVLTGDPPFKGDSAMDTLMRTMRGDYRRIRELRPDVSAATAALLQKCLAAEPEKRYPDAPALLEAMEICRASLDAEMVPGETVGRVEGLAAREERGKRVISSAPPVPRAPGAAGRRHRARPAAKSPVAAFAAVGVIAIGALVVWSAVGGASQPARIPPPPSAAPAPAPAADRGPVETGVEVTSEPPGGLVEIDGRVVGGAPRFRPYPAYGTHDVRVTMPGYAPWTKSPVVVRADGRTKVEAKLSRALNSLAIEGAAPGGRVKLVRDGDPPKEYSATLDAQGGAKMSQVESGTYTMFIERAGFDPFKRAVVVPDEGATAPYAARMTEHAGALSVDSNPKGAAVFLDDQRVGATPLAGFALAAGRHALVLRMAGYADARRTIEIHGDETNDAGVVALPAFATVDLSRLGDDVAAKIGGEPLTKDTKLVPGAVEVTFEKKGCAPQKRTFDAPAGAALSLVPEPWDKYQAQVDVGALPAGTRVFVDGEEMKGPVIGWPTPKKARLDIRRPGFERESFDVSATVGTKQTVPEFAWKEVRTQVDFVDLPPGLAVWIDGKPAKEGAFVKPGRHVIGFGATAGAASTPIDVDCRRSIRPPVYLREPVVAAALDWLARHQSADGSWSSDRFIEQSRIKPADCPGAVGYDVGVTALALSAFLGAGESPDSGPHKDVVAAGLRRLRKLQSADGCIGPRSVSNYLVQNAVATAAVADAYRVTGDLELRDAARRGVAFACKARNANLGWRYESPPNGENDTDATCWGMRAVNAAARAEIDVDRDAAPGALAWVERMTEPEFGKTGYNERGGAPAREARFQNVFPSAKSECMTAAGVLVRLWTGRAKDDEFVVKGADLMMKKLPKWDVDAGTIDFCYWNFATCAMARVGGDRWKAWREACSAALVPHQRADPTRDDRGSWDGADPWSSVGGRVYATAINCLTLECVGAK